MTDSPDRDRSSRMRAAKNTGRTRICIVTTAHLTNNPRVVKEADALSRHGYDVVVIASQHQTELLESDRRLIAEVTWTAKLVRWCRESDPGLFWYSRVRQHLCRRTIQLLEWLGWPFSMAWLEMRALDRVLPELLAASLRSRPEFLIGHNPATLAVVHRAARKMRATVGYDAEDYLPGIPPPWQTMSPGQRLLERCERRLLGSMDYLSAASPLIAETYERELGVEFDVVALNAFEPVPTPTARDMRNESPVSLYWVSQVIGAGRGLEEVLRAMALLTDLPVTLYVRGFWQRGYEQRLRALADTLRVAQHRLVRLDRVGLPELVRRSACFDIGLAVERTDTPNRDICVTNKLLLYLSAGLAVAATETRGQSLIMSRIPGAGFTYTPGDHCALARGLRRWIENRRALHSAQDAAYRAALSTYSLAGEQQKVAEAVNRVLVRPARLAVTPATRASYP